MLERMVPFTTGGYLASCRLFASRLSLLAVAVIMVAGGLQGCAGPVPNAAGTGITLYVLSGRDGTLVPLDGTSGRVLGPPLPAGLAPAQAVPGPAGGFLALSFSRLAPGTLTRISPAGRGWQTAPVLLPVPLRWALLAGDGGRYAAIVHHVIEIAQQPIQKGQPGKPATPGCRLEVLDALTGMVVRTHTACGPAEEVRDLVLENTPGGPVAYLGIGASRMSGASAAAGGARSANVGRSRDRVVALDALTGALVAEVALTGPPEHIHLAPARERSGSRLYLVEPAPGAENEYSADGHWRLLGLDTVTFALEREVAVHIQLRALAIAPDGDHAYALPAGGKSLLHLDLRTGDLQQIASLPHASVGLAATANHVYVPDPEGNAVWRVDRHRPDRMRRIPVNRRPTTIVVRHPA
jgi:hypothetical protein